MKSWKLEAVILAIGMLVMGYLSNRDWILSLVRQSSECERSGRNGGAGQ